VIEHGYIIFSAVSLLVLAPSVVSASIAIDKRGLSRVEHKAMSMESKSECRSWLPQPESLYCYYNRYGFESALRKEIEKPVERLIKTLTSDIRNQDVII